MPEFDNVKGLSEIIDESTPKGRLERELFDLVDKRDKLFNFTLTPEFSRLSAVQQYLLKEQLDCMNKYANILEVRLSVWED